MNGAANADWLASIRASTLAWWLPQAAIVTALLAPISARTLIWIAALSWMGIACVANARRCGRTHCRYTGPYYFIMTIPVIALASSVLASEILAWIALGAAIVLGGKIVWWLTERRWGKYSSPAE